MKPAFFSEKDVPLRDDIRTLGSLLGNVIRDQEGDDALALVETVRKTARRRRDGETAAGTELQRLLTGLSAERSGMLVRAFSAFFGAMNMCERVHRIRRRRAAMREARVQSGGLAAVFERLAQRGHARQDLSAILARLLVEPVFTAHPTEAIRRTLLVKEQRIARALVDRIEPERLVPRENRACLARIREELAIAWQTEEHAHTRPTVADEREHVLFFLADVIYRIVPAFHEHLEETCGHAVPRPVLRFNSWVGGDMDGNPAVDADTIRASLRRHRELIVQRYLTEVRQLFDALSQSRSRVAVDAAVLDRIERYEEELDAAVPVRYHDMPYRVLLWHISVRLERSLSDQDGAYTSGDGLLDDLRLIESSLRSHRGTGAGLHRIRRLARRVQTFGFFLAALDIRQDAEVHRRVVGCLLAVDDFPSLPAVSRAEHLRRMIVEKARGQPAEDDEAARSLDVFQAIGEGRSRFGAESIGLYIISMAQGPDDVLAVLALAQVAGLVEEGQIPLDVAPLFETVADLRNCRETFEALLQDPVYSGHLDGRGRRQTVVLGYSDSAKDSGLAASRWALYRAQQDLVAAARQHGVELTLFHGRGGSISRGGSKPRAAVMAAPPGAVDGRLRVTEQGEIIFAKYGLRDIALRTLELTVGAVIEATADLSCAGEPEPAWLEAMDEVARASRQEWRSLVYETPGFFDFFRQATPIDVIERLTIGSRPSRRRAGRGVEDLRAIPWVFAWTQSRLILPGWYGVGSGLKAAAERFGEETLRAMAARWPFFSVLLGDVAMVLAKTDAGIARRYADLAADPAMQKRIEAELELTERLVCELQSCEGLLDNEPVLRRALLLRNPYVDPMSYLQVDLLRRWRTSGRSDDGLLRVLMATVRGIARGMQNTG